MSYLWFGNTLNAKKIFYLMSVFRDLRHCLGTLIPYGMGRAAEFYTSVVRIQQVLNGLELKLENRSNEPTSKPVLELKEAVVHIRELLILKKISFKVDSKLTLVTGTVGSGKSSLLKTMLQDYPLTSGSIISYGRVSYASQDPWLFPSSIRQNVLFGQNYDEKRSVLLPYLPQVYSFAYFLGTKKLSEYVLFNMISIYLKKVMKQ